MHKHKQSQCKRKVKHRKNLMGLIIFCITVCIVFMFAYYQNLRKEISVRQEWLETVLTREKKWILENQGPEGEIYMNGSKAGDVNPYFACMAALGLLAETKNCPMTETEQKAVGRYLDWHTGVLLETDGKMGIYRKEGGELIYKAINEQISNFAQTYPTNLKASSNEALLFMRRYRFANCSCFSCCFKDAYPSSNVQ